MGNGLNCSTPQGGAPKVEQVEQVQCSTTTPILRGGGGGARRQWPDSGVEQIAGVRALGVDIGRKGGIAYLVGSDLIAALDMPTLPDGPASRPSISAPLLADIIRQLAPEIAYVEWVGPRPTDGAKAAFAFGAAKATVEAVLLVLGVPVQFITPQVWKRLHGIPPGRDQKDIARATAVRRWPGSSALFARAGDDGRAEAALIAVAGLMRDEARKAAA